MRRALGIGCGAGVLGLLGCGGEATLDPPGRVHYGQVECAVCAMIVSDERFAAALVTIEEGRREVRFLDDVGEMADLRPGEGVAHRWYVHDMRTREWVEAGRAVYLRSDRLHTPMGTGIGAFADRAGAEEALAEYGGEIASLDAVLSGGP